MRRFALLFALLSLNFYAVSRILLYWDWAEAHPVAAWSGAFLFFLLQLMCPFISRRFFPALPKSPVLGWASYGAFGLMSLLVVYGLATDIVSVLLKSFAGPDGVDTAIVLILAVLTAITVVIGVGQAHFGPAVVRVSVPLKNLPKGFDGFTIAQVSDLHVGPTIRRRYTQKVVDIVNGLKPDMIALTGDFIDGTVAELSPHVAPLSHLKAPDGIFFVTGNHEYYWNAEA